MVVSGTRQARVITLSAFAAAFAEAREGGAK